MKNSAGQPQQGQSEPGRANVNAKTNAPTLSHLIGHTLAHFPWRTTASVLSERFREDRLGLVAGSLTFTTITSLVPLLAVALALFSLFPAFAEMQNLLQKWFANNLIPSAIARQVLGYLTAFATKANRLGGWGFAFLLLSSVILVFTIDHSLNNIWRVRQRRPATQRLLIYWALLSLGPLLLAGSLALSSLALAWAQGWLGIEAGAGKTFINMLGIALMVLGLACTYRYVPHSPVRWEHAWIGAMVATTGLEISKIAISWYFFAPGSSAATLYGAFAALPVLFVWVYIAWLMVLFGAVIAAYLPSLLAGVARHGAEPGFAFTLALEILALLHSARLQGLAGYSQTALATRMRVGEVQLEEVLEPLQALGWIGRLGEDEGRYILLVQPESTPINPLVERLLLAAGASTQRFAHGSHWAHSTLADALPVLPASMEAQT